MLLGRLWVWQWMKHVVRSDVKHLRLLFILSWIQVWWLRSQQIQSLKRNLQIYFKTHEPLFVPTNLMEMDDGRYHIGGSWCQKLHICPRGIPKGPATRLWNGKRGGRVHMQSISVRLWLFSQCTSMEPMSGVITRLLWCRQSWPTALVLQCCSPGRLFSYSLPSAGYGVPRFGKNQGDLLLQIDSSL